MAIRPLSIVEAPSPAAASARLRETAVAVGPPSAAAAAPLLLLLAMRGSRPAASLSVEGLESHDYALGVRSLQLDGDVEAARALLRRATHVLPQLRSGAALIARTADDAVRAELASCGFTGTEPMGGKSECSDGGGLLAFASRRDPDDEIEVSHAAVHVTSMEKWLDFWCDTWPPMMSLSATAPDNRPPSITARCSTSRLRAPSYRTAHDARGSHRRGARSPRLSS